MLKTTNDTYVTFELKKEHIKLLKSLNFETVTDTQYKDLFAPSINIKRPFGNTDVLRSVCQIFDMDEKTLTKEQKYDLWKLVIELPVALEVIMYNETFVPAIYLVKKSGSWQEYQMRLKYLMIHDDTVQTFWMMTETLEDCKVFGTIQTLCKSCLEENPYKDVLDRMKFMRMDEKSEYAAKCMKILEEKAKEFRKNKREEKK